MPSIERISQDNLIRRLGPARPLNPTAVQLHTGPSAQRLAADLGADALTWNGHIAFARNRYRPETREGQRLLAHELVHAAQQREAGLTDVIHRDLATPPPATSPPDQPELAADQARRALAFNRARYDQASTRLIQQVLGGPVTGAWTEENVRAIAATQEEYGLLSDGKVGWETYRFLVNEIGLEGLPVDRAHCPIAFWVEQGVKNVVPTPDTVMLNRRFTMNADFPGICDCSRYEYRQFIRGHFFHTQGGTRHDMGTWFANLPSGRLRAAWREDGNTTMPGTFYGHRDRAPAADNRYLDDTGAVDMADGCRFRGTDEPGGGNALRDYRGGTSAAGAIVTPQSGDRLEFFMTFRGEIREDGNAIITERWTSFDEDFTLPDT